MRERESEKSERKIMEIECPHCNFVVYERPRRQRERAWIRNQISFEINPLLDFPGNPLVALIKQDESLKTRKAAAG